MKRCSLANLSLLIGLLLSTSCTVSEDELLNESTVSSEVVTDPVEDPPSDDDDEDIIIKK